VYYRVNVHFEELGSLTVGRFSSAQAAERWAEENARRYGGTGWMVELVNPWICHSVPAIANCPLTM
jgi:hypothetical protein